MITIIVLLILAGVAISSLSGENGILGNAGKAKEQTEIGKEIEQIKLAVTGAVADNLGGDITKTNLESNLSKQGLDVTVTEGGENFAIKIKDLIKNTDRYYIVDQNGNVKEHGKIDVGEKALKNSTIDGNVGTYNNPIIPKGFKAVNVGTATWGTANGYQNGLVIEDATGDSITNGSQFVWVPVEDIAKFVRKDWQNWSGVTTEEPSAPSSSYKENETTYEYTQMKNSVTTYGGFYVARYEAGITDTSKKSTQDGTIKPVSRNTNVWNCIPWGGTTTAEAIDGYQGNDKANGAVKVARSMYPDTEKITEYALPAIATNNTGAKSTLIYGVQWDSIMRWMKEIENSSATKTSPQNKYILDSAGKGNYQDSDSTNNPAATGTNNYAVKNIFDMAGNVWEWTMEAYLTINRVYRGGNYNISGSNNPASYRNNDYTPSYSNNNIGFRVTLYL